MNKKPDESMGSADEKVPPEEAFVDSSDIEDPLHEVGLHMDPSKCSPNTSQSYFRPLFPSFFPLCLISSVLE